MSHEGCGPNCLCHELRDKPKRVVPSPLTRCYMCAACKLWFAAESNSEASFWHRNHHIKYCPGNDYYRRAFAA